VRRKQQAKLAAIAAAALTVFSRDGFASAQVADIAREAQLSVGTLYLYADGKQALFELAVEAAFPGADVAAERDLRALPKRPCGMDATADLIEQASRERARWPVLRAALRAAVAGDAEPEVAGVVGEMFDLMSRERPIIRLLDRCAWELPELHQVYGAGLRARYFRDVEQYVRSRRAAAHRAAEDSAAIGRAVIEMVAWMAMHRLAGKEPTSVETATARRACVALACGGMLGASAAVR
jgi:AcrR family transcriptional regulator